MDSLCGQSIPVCGPEIGSKQDFEAFVREHMKDAYRIALGLVGNREDALELSQEAFYRAYQHYDQLSAQGKFFAWFYQILRNLCFSHLRKRRVRRASSLEEGEEGGPQLPVGDHFDPQTIAQRNESKDRLWRAIGQLDDKHREVIMLRHFQNLSYDEMAKLLFCNRGTVTSRLFYARQKLKELLEHETAFPNDARVEGVPPSNRGQDARDTQGQDALATERVLPREPQKGGQTP